MPNLPAHIDLAYKAAQRLDHPALEADKGCFLLGSTAPDIRVITRGRREDYHFAPLEFESIGAGVEGLFSSHPNLLSHGKDDGPLRSFVAGYITHLIADEVWIVDMFRPHFGNPEVFEDEAVGQVMDRAMQLELDRQAWETLDGSPGLLDAGIEGIDVGFIPSETLEDWQKWVLDFVDRGFSWDRLRFMARRIAAGDEGHPAHLVADEFLQGMPDSLDRLHQLVGRRDLADYKERTIEELGRAVGDYLS